MRSSTLHRSGLTREKMNILANFQGAPDKKQVIKNQLGEYYHSTKSKELDLLWNGAQKGIRKVQNITKNTYQKSPAAYLLIGFVSGVIFALLIFLLISVASVAPKVTSQDSNVAIISDEASSELADNIVSEEKYIVKKGDTLNGIAYRFYGKYDEKKILEIQKINNIANPQSISIGQELIIPVSQER